MGAEVFSEPHVTARARRAPSGSACRCRRSIRAYDRAGKVLREIAGGEDPKLPFKRPMGLTYDKRTNELVVVDLENRSSASRRSEGTGWPGVSQPPRTYPVALRAAVFPLRHPAVWAWPVALGLTLYASRKSFIPEVALNYYLAALGLVLLGCLPSFVTTRPPRRELPQAPFLPRGLLVWLTAAVLLFAAVVRVWKLWEWPPHGIGFEEFQIAARGDLGPQWAQNFLTLYARPGEHTLTAYAISLSFAFLGTGFLAMRVPFVIVSILCPILLYAVCRKLVAWEVSLFAVALFAVSWWQIAAGRAADEIFFPMWAEIAILWLLLHFEDTGRTWAAFFLALLSGLLSTSTRPITSSPSWWSATCSPASCCLRCGCFAPAIRSPARGASWPRRCAPMLRERSR